MSVWLCLPAAASMSIGPARVLRGLTIPSISDNAEQMPCDQDGSSRLKQAGNREEKAAEEEKVKEEEVERGGGGGTLPACRHHMDPAIFSQECQITSITTQHSVRRQRRQ